MMEVSNADRIVFPEAGLTKGDVVGHYARVAGVMLPHLRQRPLTLVRHPRGIAKKGFFQKNAGKHYPDFITRIPVKRGGGVTQHAAVDDEAGLCFLANQGTIELHTVLRQAPHLNVPDRLVLDLDPPEGELSLAQQAALDVKALLDELGVASTPVASGGKGYHVYVALEPSLGGRDVSRAAHILASILAERHPDRLTLEILKDKRDGRVLLDHLRNVGMATVVAPYSLRARRGAPVAVPIRWDELSSTPPDAFRATTIDARLSTPDPLLALPREDPKALLARCEAMRDERGIELRYIDRFGRER